MTWPDVAGLAVILLGMLGIPFLFMWLDGRGK